MGSTDEKGGTLCNGCDLFIGRSCFLKFFLQPLKGKCVFKLDIIALLLSHVNKETEKCSSEIQLVPE